jgi:3-oxoacid CoA-transferase subunit A
MKYQKDALEVLASVVQDGMTIAVGGFGLSGNPTRLIHALRDTGAKDLTIVSNNMGIDGKGLGILLENQQVSKVIASYVGENSLFAEQYLSGALVVEFSPQGTLAERLRAGGVGVPAFFTATGVGTEIAAGKEEQVFNGRRAILERGIRADIALVKAHTADAEGNLRYRKTAMNFNPLAAMSGQFTMAEAEHMLDNFMDPELVHTPGIFVQTLVDADPVKEIENVTVRALEEVGS